MNSIPEELKVNARWVCCTADKRPICPATGAPASSTDPATWASYAAAVQAVPRLGCRGIGYVLGDGLCGIDIDHCMTCQLFCIERIQITGGNDNVRIYIISIFKNMS